MGDVHGPRELDATSRNTYMSWTNRLDACHRSTGRSDTRIRFANGSDWKITAEAGGMNELKPRLGVDSANGSLRAGVSFAVHVYSVAFDHSR